jgi:hypothetical protein
VALAAQPSSSPAFRKGLDRSAHSAAYASPADVDPQGPEFLWASRKDSSMPALTLKRTTLNAVMTASVEQDGCDGIDRSVLKHGR